MHLGSFLRIRSDQRGDAFNLTMNFDEPIKTLPGKSYLFSFYSIINCGNSRCINASDTVTARIKDGDNGIFHDVYTVFNRSTDSQWYHQTFMYTANDQNTFVKEIYI